MSYSLIFKHNSKEYYYTLTNDDILNLLRATYKEGGQKDAVAYTLLNRFAWLYPSGVYKNLSSFISAYSQPLNPKWFPNGSAHLASVKSIKNKYSGTELQSKLEYANKLANQRILNTVLDIDSIPETTKSVVYSILNGKIKNPVKGAVHFIASTAGSGDSEQIAFQKQKDFAAARSDLGQAIEYESAIRGNNWFFTSPGSNSFTVHIEKNNRVVEAGMGFPGYFILIGLAGYLLMRFTRK